MSITVLGDIAKTIFLKGPESHKLHHQFAVASGVTVLEGQPVKLNATGEVQPLGGGGLNKLCIGFAVHSGTDGELVTVVMKAFAIIFASTSKALVTGPVQYEGVNATDGDYMDYEAAVDADHEDVVGWALDAAAGADEIIRVALGN